MFQKRQATFQFTEPSIIQTYTTEAITKIGGMDLIFAAQFSWATLSTQFLQQESLQRI